MKKSMQAAVAARARGHRLVRGATVTLAALATGTSASLAWAASSTATGRAHATTITAPAGPKSSTAQHPKHHRHGDDLPPPAGPVPGSLTAPPQASAPTTDPNAYVPQPAPYVPPVVSSGGS